MKLTHLHIQGRGGTILCRADETENEVTSVCIIFLTHFERFFSSSCTHSTQLTFCRKEHVVQPQTPYLTSTRVTSFVYPENPKPDSCLHALPFLRNYYSNLIEFIALQLLFCNSEHAREACLRGRVVSLGTSKVV